MSINSNLEQDLRNYCNTLDNNLFEKNIYQPLKNLASAICTRKSISRRMIHDGIIDDMVSSSITRLPDYYDEKKGSAKATIFILMSQYLGRNLRFNGKKKRDCEKTIYIEEIENFDGYTSRFYEIEFDELQLYKQTLLEQKDLFNRLKTKLNVKIANTIIDCINNPRLYKNTKNSYIKSISIKCNCSIHSVYGVIKQMRELLISNGFLYKDEINGISIH